MNSGIAREIVRSWLPLAVLATLLCGLIYVNVQQNLRAGANDPQIQMAEDAARALAKGQAPQSLVLGGSQVDIAESLAPFLVIYDDFGRALASSGILHGQAPILPSGVLDFARKYGEDRTTWQPEGGVRSAIIVARFSGAAS